MKGEYLLLAINGLKERKLRSWLTMIGIFIGIAAVVALMGLGEGLRTAITGQFGFTVCFGRSSGPGSAKPPLR